MPAVTNRNTFKDYCLRRLGFPTIEINVDDDQVEDRIDDALQYWQDYHFDALQKVYYIRALNSTDMSNKYINLNPYVCILYQLYFDNAAPPFIGTSIYG
jgi:hypothetical protein